MRTAVQLAAGPDWPRQVEYVQEAERLGVDVVWVAEAWGADAVGPLANLAARTERVLLGSGILQLGARSAAMTAQTAITLAILSEGRFLLGLGASGPQVMEGLHGVPFPRPLSRMRDQLAVLEAALAGERIAHESPTLQLPLPGGEGKALRLAVRTEHAIPVYLAALSPKMLELTGARADGWLGTSFVPEGADAYLRHLRTGAEQAGRSLDDLDLCQGAEVAFAADEDELARMVDERRGGLAFSLGGMGSAETNFYNRAYARQGFAQVAAESQRRWIAGDRTGAAEIIPDEMVLATTLVGTEDMVRERLATWRDTGITTIRLYPAGEDLDERLETLARALDLNGSLD